MSKSPDLSAFPIPRKGEARPIAVSDERARAEPILPPDDERAGRGTEQAAPSPYKRQGSQAPSRGADRHAPVAYAPPPTPSGQLVATTVKLDENRYLRLSEAGRPEPGRLKRRTIQDIMVEALDEWFERRGL